MVARSKTDSYLTQSEQTAITYLTSIGLQGCRECYVVRRKDCIKEDGACLWCHGEATPELTARLEADKALLQKLRKKLKRVNARKSKNLTKKDGQKLKR